MTNKHLSKNIIVFLVFSFLFSGCANTHKLSKRRAKNIDSFSIVVNIMISSETSYPTDANGTAANDITGLPETPVIHRRKPTYDVVDIPANKGAADSLVKLFSDALIAKGYKIADQHISVGNILGGRRYYVIDDPEDREKRFDELPLKSQLLYSDRLDYKQLAYLNKSVLGKANIRHPESFGFKGDAVLVYWIYGRETGADTKAYRTMGNGFLLVFGIFGALIGGAAGGSPNLSNMPGFAVDDQFSFREAIWSNTTGRIQMFHRGRNDLSGLHADSANTIINNIPNKKK